ncbi:MAG: ABC transporter permease [Pseudomonadota bacterium]
MSDILILAVAYVRHTAIRSAVLVTSLALILAVPLATQTVLDAAESHFTERAETTPVIIGARGSALDLIMNGLYFTADRPERITMAEVERLWDEGLATPVPLHVRYTAGGQPVVGTTLEYFELRDLEVAAGRGLALLGEAVLGASAAVRLDLRAGDVLLTDPENLFDIGGAYPLELSVVGVLAPTGTADDEAVFVDVTTAWVIEGIGHGHADVVETDMVVGSSEGALVASRAVQQFNRITPETIATFHFHGDRLEYPISSVIAVPPDARNAAVLRGRYIGREDMRAVVPGVVIEALLETVFRIGRILDAVFAVVGVAASFAILLALYLSIRMRETELRTASRIGAARWRIAALLGADAALIGLGALALALLAEAMVSARADTLAVWLLTARGL